MLFRRKEQRKTASAEQRCRVGEGARSRSPLSVQANSTWSALLCGFRLKNSNHNNLKNNTHPRIPWECWRPPMCAQAWFWFGPGLPPPASAITALMPCPALWLPPSSTAAISVWFLASAGREGIRVFKFSLSGIEEPSLPLYEVFLCSQEKCKIFNSTFPKWALQIRDIQEELLLPLLGEIVL